MKKTISSVLLAMSLFAVSSIANAGFEVEPNDRTSDSTALPVNEVFEGTFPNYRNTADYYRFTLTESRTDVTFRFRNKVGNSTYTNVYLRDSAGKTITYKKIDAFNTTELSFTQSLGAGVFYLLAYSYSTPKADVNYELSVSTKVSVTPSIVGSVGMPDLNEDGKKDVAILRIQADTAAVVETRDGANGELMNSATVLDGEQPALKPISIAELGDNLVSVVVNNTLEKTYSQYIIDVVSGETVNTFPLD